MTLQLAMAQEHQISFLKKENPDVLENIISLLVDLLAVQFNVKDNFSGIQIVDCTLSIIEKYWYLRPEEVMFCFKQGKLGKYGPVYNKLDTPTILTWLHKYDTQDRISAAEAVRDPFKNDEKSSDFDIMAAYQSEKKFLEEHGMPKIAWQSKQKKEKELAKLKEDDHFRKFMDDYFEKQKAAQ